MTTANTKTDSVYIITKEERRVEILDAHRRLEYARNQLREIEEQARKEGARCLHTQAGCCLRVQKGDAVTYYEIKKAPLR